MIPYLGTTEWVIVDATRYVPEISIKVWGAFVACGFGVGTFIAYHRAKNLGLQAKSILDLAFWVLLSALLGSRVFHLVAYAWPGSWQDLLSALDPRAPGFAIIGGFMGAGIATAIYLRKHRLPLLPYADAMAFGLPWGCGIGRIGCFLIHDHPGTLSNWLLAVRYPDGSTRHDLGLYLSIVGFVTGFLFLFLARRKRGPGFWLGTYMIIEGASRLTLDALRIQDARFFSLTPTQWLALPLLVGGVLLLNHSRKTL